MSKIEERKSVINQFVELAEESGAVGAVIVRGDDATESGDLRVDAVPYEASEIGSTYTRINYILSSELDITDSKPISRDENSRVKMYALENGVQLTVRVAPLEAVQNDGGWYRIVFDDMNAASVLGAGVPEDILCDLAPAPAPAPAEEAQPEPEPTIAPVPVPVEAVPAQVIAEEPKQDMDDETKEYIEFVARNMKNAQRSIASGQMIRAGEIIGMLRKMAIELICVRQGIEENFDQAIDFIECEEKHMIEKTYPRSMDQTGYAMALATLSELFDRLI